jgi:hypothetical protein
MSNKDKILHVLNTENCDTIESLLFAYLNRYPKEFSVLRLMHTDCTATERAVELKIKNAQAIIDAYKIR